MRAAGRSSRVLFATCVAFLVLVGPADEASPAVAAILPASITTSFGAATIALNSSVSLSFSISNPNTLSTLTIGFTDTLPSGLVVATPSGLTNSCGGTASAAAGSTSVTLSGASLGHGTCNLSVNVTGTSAGKKDNSVTVTSEAGGNTAMASVTVVAPPSEDGVFATKWVAVGGKTRLSIEPYNPNTATTLHNVGFTDTLPAGLVVASPNGLSVLCGGGSSVTAVAGSHQIKLSGATLTPDGTSGAYCAIDVDVRGVTNGVATDSGTTSSTEGGSATFSESIPVVGAGPRVFWANDSYAAGTRYTFEFARLDGSVGSSNPTNPAWTDEPQGMAIDPTTGRIYWLNFGGPFGVSFVSFDGKAYGNLNVAGGDAARSGLAIDPLHGRIYWTGNEHVSFARLDGTGGGTIPITGATPPFPTAGIAIDIAGGRLYWISPNAISYARLDGSGGGDIPLVGTMPNQPNGVAIDPTAKKIYWTNGGNNTIGVANLDGTAATTLSISGAMLKTPYGLAIDFKARRLYWANEQPGANTISWAPLSGGAGGNLATPGTTVNDTDTLLLLYPPASLRPPQISGHSTVGSKLTCSTGTWAKDSGGASFYLAPFAITYAWTRNGTTIARAKTNTITASSSGSYACAATGTNMAGATTRKSAPKTIS